MYLESVRMHSYKYSRVGIGLRFCTSICLCKLFHDQTYLETKINTLTNTHDNLSTIDNHANLVHILHDNIFSWENWLVILDMILWLWQTIFWSESNTWLELQTILEQNKWEIQCTSNICPQIIMRVHRHTLTFQLHNK